MTMQFGRLRTLGFRAGGFLMAGALVAAIAPAAAMAADIAANDHLLAKAENGEVQWPDGAWTVYGDGGSYVWSTYVKGDGSHYGHYDLDVAFNVQDGVLQSVGISSPGKVVGGPWSTNSTITGSLPEGVEDDTAVDADAKTVIPAIEGAEAYGGVSWKAGKNSQPVQFFKATEEDGLVVLGKAVSLTAGEDGAYSYADADVNVVELVPKVGNWFAFKYYLGLDEDGERLADALNEQEATDYDATITGIGAKNRDMWSQTALASMIEQQLARFVADDEYDLDIVSSATKSSDAIIEALYASQGVYYPISNNDDAANAAAPEGWNDAPIFTEVADDLAILMDGTQINTADSLAEVDAEGNRVLTVNFSEGFDYTPGGATAVNVVGYDLFAMDGVEGVDDASDYLLRKARNAGEGVDGIDPVASVLVCARSKSHDPAPELTAEAGATDVATYDPATNQLTVTDPTVTHAIVWFNHDTHANYCGVVYDLVSMAPVAAATDISNAVVTLAKASAAYTGKDQAGAVKSVALDGKTLVEGTDYTVDAKSGKNVGSYAVTVTGKGDYTGTASASYKITQAPNTLKVKTKAVSAKAKKKTTAKASKAFKVTKTGGSVSYKKVSGNKKISVSKAGKVTVKKGLKKGKTYRVRVKVTAGDANYQSVSKTVTLKVKVK